ncbi:hypothetical protein [Mesorhizobium sp. WSM1293]|uniref:hypothetical protein n=1 Tax=Mesorhizobium sp. WSM1293 TaxID=1040984 RepID=UPI0004868BFD|nr:hypothetical protein [Mesorhizobium sp. WSM1293]
MPPAFIIDTDFTGDPDDTMAMAVALAAHKVGKIRIVGFIVSSTTPTSAPGLYGLLKAYGYQSIPIYAYQGSTGTYNVTYPTQLRDRFGVAGQTRTAFIDDLTGYRTLVSSNKGCTIIGIGAPVALSRFLSSPADSIDARTGAQLIAQNVSRAVQMAGNFPSGGAAEYNMTRDLASSNNVIANWPSTVPFMWTGGEVGGTVNTMAPLDADPLVDPIRYAFDLGGATYISSAGRRASWDPIATYYAIYGLGSLFSVGGANGSITVDGTGVVTWSAATPGPHSYLAKVAADDRIANPIDIIVDGFIMANRPNVTSFMMSMNEGTGQTVTSDDGKVIGNLGAMKIVETIDPVWTDQGTSQWGLVLSTGKVISLPPNVGYDSANIAGGGIIKPTAITGTQMVLAMYDLGPNAKFMFRNNAGKLNFIGYTAADGATNFNVSSAAVVLTAATWAMCTFEIIGTTLSMFVNGVQVYTGTVSGSLYVGKRLIRPTIAGRWNSNAVADALGGAVICAAMKAGASAGDHVAIETSLRANATAKGITIP